MRRPRRVPGAELGREMAMPVITGISLAFLACSMLLVHLGVGQMRWVVASAALAVVSTWVVPPPSASLGSGHHYLGAGGTKAVTVEGAQTGWKVARMLARVDGSDICFEPTAHPGRIQAEAEAECAKGCESVAGPGCSCGFHAYRNESDARGHDQGGDQSTLLRVAVSGRFVEYTRGWRYSHQRIEEARIRLSCWGQACERSAQALLIPSELPLRGGWAVVGGVCEECVRDSCEGMVVLSFQEASEILTAQLRSGDAVVGVRSDSGLRPLSREEVSGPRARARERAVRAAQRLRRRTDRDQSGR